MYTGLQHTHSGLAYLVLLLLVLAVGAAKYGWFFRKPYSEGQRKLTLFAMIGSHLQLLIGLVLYMVSPLGLEILSAESMSNALARFYTVEHPTAMIIALVLITVGHVRAKRATDDRAKHFNVVLWMGLGLLLILSRIPWNVWPGN